jgi:predicted AAA+ superfamily ATPase
MMDNFFLLQNPWLENKFILKDNQIKRDLFNSVIDALKGEKPVVLAGVRQGGKTTLLYRCVQELMSSGISPKNIIYLSFEHAELRSFLRSAHEGIFELLRKWAGDALLKNDEACYILIDEIQKAPSPINLIKELLINKRSNLKLIFSSSYNLFKEPDLKALLSGNVRHFSLNPLSFEELHRIRGMKPRKYRVLKAIKEGIKPDVEVMKKEQISMLTLRVEEEKLLREVLSYGNFPRVVYAKEEKSKISAVEELISGYIEKDIRMLPQVGSSDDILGIFRALIKQEDPLLNKTNLISETGLSYNTLGKYISILEKTYMLFSLEPYASEDSRKFVKFPKLYFCDCGIRNYLTGIFDPDVIEKTGMTGNLFETFMINEIADMFMSADNDFSLSFYRTHGGQEITLLIKSPIGIIPVEIKGSARLGGKDFRTLTKFFEEYPDTPFGFIIYRGYVEHRNIDGRPIIAIPYWLT